MRRKVKVLASFTAAVWVTALLGWNVAAILLAWCALVWATVVVCNSLARDRECLVCGHRYEVGILGMHAACREEARAGWRL